MRDSEWILNYGLIAFGLVFYLSLMAKHFEKWPLMTRLAGLLGLFIGNFIGYKFSVGLETALINGIVCGIISLTASQLFRKLTS
ncbi:unnamed protein product [Brachionus calyciflorus]|uniref:Uncharacterized protein n=1 Tax=Brachionus calyciflorus TaxID=104777 RepID=A0A813M6I0_9BILA|nr:unnamed protein product [Brachionus calyciflorus]